MESDTRAHMHALTHKGGNNEAQVQGVGKQQVITQDGKTRPGANKKKKKKTSKKQMKVTGTQGAHVTS